MTSKCIATNPRYPPIPAVCGVSRKALIVTRATRANTQSGERAPYLGLRRGPGDLQRTGGDVSVVGVEGDERDRNEEREPRREGDAKTHKSAGRRPPSTSEILGYVVGGEARCTF